MYIYRHSLGDCLFRLIVFKFHKNRSSDDIMTSFLIFYHFAFLQRDGILLQTEIIIMLCHDCDTSESNLVEGDTIGCLIRSYILRCFFSINVNS